MNKCLKHKCKLVKEKFTDGNIEEEEYVCLQCIDEMEKLFKEFEENNKLINDSLNELRNLINM